jgi:hypothetical protein
LEPTWDELAKSVQGSNIHIGKVDCTTQHEVANRFGIRGYPTLKVLANGKVYDYKGFRVLDQLKGFAQQNFENVEGTPRPPKGSASIWLKLLSNPAYVFGIALLLVVLLVVCVGGILCCLGDEEPVAKYAPVPTSSTIIAPVEVKDAKQD